METTVMKPGRLVPKAVIALWLLLALAASVAYLAGEQDAAAGFSILAGLGLTPAGVAIGRLLSPSVYRLHPDHLETVSGNRRGNIPFADIVGLHPAKASRRVMTVSLANGKYMRVVAPALRTLAGFRDELSKRLARAHLTLHLQRTKSPDLPEEARDIVKEHSIKGDGDGVLVFRGPIRKFSSDRRAAGLILVGLGTFLGSVTPMILADGDTGAAVGLSITSSFVVLIGLLVKKTRPRVSRKVEWLIVHPEGMAKLGETTGEIDWDEVEKVGESSSRMTSFFLTGQTEPSASGEGFELHATDGVRIPVGDNYDVPLTVLRDVVEAYHKARRSSLVQAEHAG